MILAAALCISVFVFFLPDYDVVMAAAAAESVVGGSVK